VNTSSWPGFDPQPTLTGELVSLRPLRPDDHDILYAVLGDPLIWEQHPARERATPAGFRRYFDESLASGGALLATDSATGAVIGSSRYFGLDRAASEVEIGWSVLGRTHWGGRYNGEMKRLMLEHAFRFVEHVVFLVDAQNIRSQRAVLKIGGVPIAPRRRPDGRESLVFRITREGFAAR